MIGSHFSVSALMNFANSAGGIGSIMSKPMAIIFSRITGSRRILAISTCQRSTTVGGVPAGAPKPSR